MSFTILNAEAVRPRSRFVWEKVLWIVISNDTLKRQMLLKSAVDSTHRTTFDYTAGAPIQCESVPHLRSV